MRRQILAPILSGFILPGSGQVLNRQFVKAGLLIGSVTVLFILILVKILIDVNRALRSIPEVRLEPALVKKLAAMVSAQDHSYLIIVVGALFVIWIYSIIDAFIYGRRMDKTADETSDV